MKLTAKQKEYLSQATHRWNIKTGATGAGKSWLDYTCVIPMRIREADGGQIFLVGNTQATIKRNILDPMRQLWGSHLVPEIIKPDGSARLFGRNCYILGADKITQVSKIQGATCAYAYGDELTTWSQPVFEMLKSRLRTASAKFDGTCNPADPSHWLKKFIDSTADTYVQHYTIDDNPTLPQDFTDNLKKEYTGVYYDRYIKGLWTKAEGLVFPQLASNPEKVTTTQKPHSKNIERIVIGVDFGGYGSATAYTATAHLKNSALHVIASSQLPANEDIDAQTIAEAVKQFYEKIRNTYENKKIFIMCDSASPTMINTLRSNLKNCPNPPKISGALKTKINTRPQTISKLIATHRLHIDTSCQKLLNSLTNLCWDAAKPDQPEDKNIGNINDIYDSFCYSFTDWQEKIDLS